MTKPAIQYLSCSEREVVEYQQTIEYRMEGKFGGGKVWRIDSFQAFGEIKFGKLIDRPIDY